MEWTTVLDEQMGYYHLWINSPHILDWFIDINLLYERTTVYYPSGRGDQC